MEEHSSNNLFTNSQVASSRVIYTPSPFAKASLLYLQETGTLKAIHPHVSGRKGLASYLMFVVREGSGWLEYPAAPGNKGCGGNNGSAGNKVERYELCEGDVCFIDCRCGYAQSSSERLWAISWAHWSGASMPAIWNKYCERGGKCMFHPDDVTPFTILLDKLYTTALSEDFLKDMHISELLVRLTTLLMEQTVYDEGAEHERRAMATAEKIDVSAIKSYIDTHYKDQLTLESLAERFYFSKHYLARAFKEVYGMSVGSYITIVRVGKAKELLRFSSLNIEEIGLECGYNDPNFFSRTFKKVEGVPPSVFRENWRSGKESVDTEQ